MHNSYRFGAWHRDSYTKKKEAVWANSALVLAQENTPKAAKIRVYDTSPVTLPPVRIYGYTMGDMKNAYMRLSVQVCGQETLTLANPAKKLIILGEETGLPAVLMSDS
jgi:hypothetical protein